MPRHALPDLSALAVPGGHVELRVTPGARRDAIAAEGETLRVHVTAPADRGAANEAVLRLLSRAMGIAPSRLTLVRGAASRSKRVRID